MWLSATALTRICTSPAPGGGGGGASATTSWRSATRESARIGSRLRQGDEGSGRLRIAGSRGGVNWRQRRGYAWSARFVGQDQRGILAAEAERIRHHGGDFGIA